MKRTARPLPTTLLALAAAMVAASPLVAEDASRWDEGHASRARLVAGGVSDGMGDGALLAGVEIALDPGYKTYWRSPGESGIPPVFDWSGSLNVESVEVLWPAPERFEDASGVFHGYATDVTFPLRVRPRDPTQEVRLDLNMSYGVCKEICIPAHANASVELQAGAEAFGGSLRTALERIPRQQPLGAPGPLSILAVEPVGQDRLSVRVRAPEDAQLFAEGPDGWFLAPDARMLPEAEGTGTFLVEIAERPRDAGGLPPLLFTLTGDGGAVETSASLDAGLSAR